MQLARDLRIKVIHVCVWESMELIEVQGSELRKWDDLQHMQGVWCCSFMLLG